MGDFVIRRIKRAAKRLSAAILGAGLALGRRSEGRGPIRKILVVRVDLRVGNVLLTTPLIRALQLALPDADISVLVAPSKASILDGFVATRLFDKKGISKAPIRFFRALWALRQARFDVVIDASHWHTFSVTSAALAAWTGAPVRIAHQRSDAERFANRLVAPPVDPESEVRTKLRLLDPLGIKPDRIEMQTGLGQGEARKRMQVWLTESFAGQTVVGLAPGARKADHRAPAELFAELGTQAQARGHALLVLWGPGEQELAAKVAEVCGGTVAPPSSLDELAALMRECALVVANDTGPMHLSVACQTPTLALFRSADPSRWGHSEQGHQVVVISEDDPVDNARRAGQAMSKALDGLASSAP